MHCPCHIIRGRASEDKPVIKVNYCTLRTSLINMASVEIVAIIMFIVV